MCLDSRTPSLKPHFPFQCEQLASNLIPPTGSSAVKTGLATSIEHISHVILTAITMQHRLTYGLRRSPILAALQNVPRGLQYIIRTFANGGDKNSGAEDNSYPDLLRSSQVGKTPWRYVQVQMNRSTTSRKVWNFKIPNIVAQAVKLWFTLGL